MIAEQVFPSKTEPFIFTEARKIDEGFWLASAGVEVIASEGAYGKGYRFRNLQGKTSRLYLSRDAVEKAFARKEFKIAC